MRQHRTEKSRVPGLPSPLRFPGSRARARVSYVGVCGLCMVLAGCGSKVSRPPAAAVEGRVTLDGQAVDHALITFIPTGSTKGPSAVGVIAAGEYQLEQADGPIFGAMRVEIRSAPSDDEPPPGQMSPGFTSLGVPIPHRYNSQSTLTAEIKPGEDNLFNFYLTSDTQ